MTFSQAAVLETVETLIRGEDHRTSVIDFIDSEFLEFTTEFYKDLVRAKHGNNSPDLSWYTDFF